MSTEQKPATPATEPKHEPSVLAQGLTTGWEKFKQGQLISYRVMALLLFLIVGIGVTWWILHERTKARSALWTDWDRRASVPSLKEFADANPNTLQAKLANLDIARIHLGPEGMDRMHAEPPTPGDPEAEKRAREIRAAAVRSVEMSRDEFEKALADFNHDPVIRVECMWSRAKAEAALVGIPKDGVADSRDPGKPLEPGQRRGDPAKAIEWLDKTAEAAPDTPIGKDAKKLADALRNQNTAQQVATLQASVFRLAPTLPEMEPKFPFTP